MKDLEKVHETQWNEVKKDLSELLQKRMEQVYVGTPEEVLPKIFDDLSHVALSEPKRSEIDRCSVFNGNVKPPKTEAQRLTDELIKEDVRFAENLTNKYIEITQKMIKEGNLYISPKPKPKIAFDLEEFREFIENITDQYEESYRGDWDWKRYTTFEVKDGYILKKDRYCDNGSPNCPEDKDTKILKFEVVGGE